MSDWVPTSKELWQGRDDSAEGAQAKRLFQCITVPDSFTPDGLSGKIALLGFACDEGIRRNKGRVGAKDAPDALRQAMANLAAHQGHEALVDLGNVQVEGENLEHAQHALAEHVAACHREGMRTVVLGGGHETAFGHGLGLYRAYAEKRIGVINIDAHLDLRATIQASSGTPFKQLADACRENGRGFRYLCVGASLAANTQALLDTANNLSAEIIWDTDCQDANYTGLCYPLRQFMASVDVVYLSVDLDVLSASVMAAVSAPAALGLSLPVVLTLLDEVKKSGKLRAVDFVEYNPGLDTDHLSAKAAARLVWQVCLGWGDAGTGS